MSGPVWERVEVVELRTIRDPATVRYADAFARRRDAFPGAGCAWLDDLRDRAMQQFVETGFPTIRNEAWKYTDLRRLARVSFNAAPEVPARLPRSALAPLLVEGASHRIVFVDGRLAPALSSFDNLSKGVRVTPLAQLLAEDPALLEPHLGRIAPPEAPGGLVALNTALMEDGAVLTLEDGAVVEEPVQLINLSSGQGSFAVHPRLLVVAGANSVVTLIESFAAAGSGVDFVNAVSEIDVGPGARVRHLRLQEESAAAFHIGLVRVRLERDAGYDGFVLGAGARLSRTEIRATLAGRGAECTLDGITLVRGRQHADITTDIEHASGYAQSRQVFKAVLDDQARSVFQGRVFVAEDAQRTDAHQTNRNMVLSRGAQADSKPELIIHADDVKCSHGATVGDLDRDALFYLRARGVDEATARALLIEGFVRELIDAVPGEALRARIDRTLSAWLGRHGSAKEAA